MALPQNYNASRVAQIICIIENMAFIPSKEDRNSTVLMFAGTTFDMLVGDDRSQVDSDIYPTFRCAAVDLVHAKAGLSMIHEAERNSDLWMHDQVNELKQRVEKSTIAMRDVLKRLCYSRFGVQAQQV